MRRPDRALLALAVFLPLQKYLVAFVFRLGAPLPIVRGMGWLKEALMLSVLAAGLHAFRTARRQIDAVDRVALLWLAGVTLYFALPTLLSAPGAPESLDVRVQGYRANAFFVLLFLGARHAPLPAGTAKKLAKTLGAVLALVAVGGVYQFIDPHGWIRFTQEVVQVPRYQHLVQGLTPRQLEQDFGGVERFKAHMTQAATTVQGSGWAVAAWEPTAQRVIVSQVYDHQGNHGQGTLPLLVIDAWEHAYYLQYKNAKVDFFDAVWNVVSWSDVEGRLKDAKSTSWGAKS